MCGRKPFNSALSLLAGAWLMGLVFALLPGSALAAAGRITVMSGGLPRNAILVQHRRLKQARRPAIMILRGMKDKGGRLKRTFSLEEMAATSGAVLVYPEPLLGHWEAAHGQGQSRDVIFIQDLLARLVARGIVDRSKVFLVGAGSGGILALRLACDGRTPIAGVAVLGASLPSELGASCTPPRPIPLMIVADADDPALPYHGGAASVSGGKTELLPVEATLRLFGKAASCGSEFTSISLPEKELRHGARAFLDKLNDCTVPIEAIRMEKSAHPPAAATGEAPALHGLPLSDVNSARLVWDFLRPLGG